METQQCVQSFKLLMGNVSAEAKSFTACLLVIKHLSDVVICRIPVGHRFYLFLFLNPCRGFDLCLSKLGSGIKIKYSAVIVSC